MEEAGVRCDWKATNEGGELRYNVYRVQGTALGPGQEWVRVGDVTAVPGQVDYSFVDEGLLVKGQDYLYFATAVYLREGEGTAVEMESDASNTDVVIGPNHPPVANALSVTMAEDTAAAITLTGSDIHGDALTYTVMAGPLQRELVLNAGGSGIYTPTIFSDRCLQLDTDRPQDDITKRSLALGRATTGWNFHH